MSAVPKLRFPEFSSSNTKVKFDEVFAFSSGKNIKQAEANPHFKIPCVRYGELYHMYGEVITKTINFTNLDRSELKFSEGDEILLPSAGEDPLDIGSASALKVKGVAIGRTINVLRPLKSGVYEPVYMSYLINQVLRTQIAALAKGVSISNVYNSDLKSLSANIPSLPEQRKIASFLSSVDKKIDLLRQKKDALELYKKGLMQKIFSQEIRFKQDDGSDFPDWEEVALGNVADVYQPKTISQQSLSKDAEYLVYGANGVIGKFHEFNHEKEQIAITCRGSTCGFVNLTQPYSWITGNAMVVNVDSSKNIVKNFLYYLLKSTDWSYQISGSGQPQITGSIKKHKMFLPFVAEQKKIASFLSVVDTRIQNTSSQIEQMETFKKGLLQQMFV